MSKFIPRATYVSTPAYTGATALAQRALLWDALQVLGLTDSNRATVTATATLSLAQCGLLLVDATAGNVVLTLPTAGAAADEAIYLMRRIDATANTVTVQRGSTDTIEGAATALAVLPGGMLELQLPAGAVNWRVLFIGGATAAAARAAVGAEAVGTGQIFFVPANVAPAGSVKANGALLSRTTYAGLYAYALASGNMAASDGAWVAGQFSPGDGATTFRIPDLRGEFVRGWDDARGVDSGRTIGSAQAQAIQSHDHNLGVVSSASDGAGAPRLSAAAENTLRTTYTAGGAETRPRSIALLACLKF